MKNFKMDIAYYETPQIKAIKNAVFYLLTKRKERFLLCKDKNSNEIKLKEINDKGEVVKKYCIYKTFSWLEETK